MSLAYYATVSVHVLAALFWLGGMFFLGVVGAPALRAVEPPELRRALFRSLGVRFRTMGWAAIAVLVVTGVMNLHFRGWLSWDVLGAAAFWRTVSGHALGIKLVAVTAMIVASALHDFRLGPAAVAPGERGDRVRRRASLLARANAFVGVIVVLAAVVLARGG
jgi:uncharacterized membrane protein